MVGGTFPGAPLILHGHNRDLGWAFTVNSLDLSEVNRLRRGNVDLGLAGAPDIVRAVYRELEEDGRFRGVAGNSYVLLVT